MLHVPRPRGQGESKVQLRPFNLRSDKMVANLADDIFKCIWILLQVSLKVAPEVRINNNPELVQIMTMHRPGEKPLSEQMMVSLLTHIYAPWPQFNLQYNVIGASIYTMILSFGRFYAESRWVALHWPSAYSRSEWNPTNNRFGNRSLYILMVILYQTTYTIATYSGWNIEFLFIVAHVFLKPFGHAGFGNIDVKLHNLWITNLNHQFVCMDQINKTPNLNGHIQAFSADESKRWSQLYCWHYGDVIMSAMATQIISLTIVCTIVYLCGEFTGDR